VAVEKGVVKSDGLHVYADAPTLRHIPRLNACSKRRNTLMFMHAPESLFIHAPFSTATVLSENGVRLIYPVPNSEGRIIATV